MKPLRVILEALLFFLAFFLPGYVAQSAPAPGNATTQAMLQVIAIGLPQLLLMVYVAELASGPPGAWGLATFERRDYLRTFLVLLGSFAAVSPFIVLVFALPPQLSRSLSAGYRWGLQSASQIPVALLFGLTAGYREEFFFRSYLFGRLGQIGVPLPLAVLCTTALFTAGHLYEGPLGIAIAATLGTLYSIVYIRRPSLHVIAIAHGLYNAIVLCLGLLVPRSLPAAAGFRIFIWN
jgi:membrane protease YdiL (CAAX protease family)